MTNPSPRAGASSAGADDSDAPVLIALSVIETFIRWAEENGKFPANIKADLRSVATLRSKLTANPGDVDALKWVRQLANSWSMRLAGIDTQRIRVLFNLLERSAEPPR